MERTVAVLGAGIVGVACALELQRRGATVTLIDRREPGQETSYGNAGILARSSLIPFNNPGLWRALPRLLRGQTPQFRYSPLFLARNPAWAAGFLANTRKSRFQETTTALDALIGISIAGHKELLAAANESRRLRDTGWLFLYKSAEGFANTTLARGVFDQFKIATQVLDRDGLRDLEPDLAPIFERAVWVKDSASVDNPGAVVTAYVRLFVERGGRVERGEIVDLRADNESWQLCDALGRASMMRDVVVALGPWAKHFLAQLGINVPMAFERGYHMHYRGDDSSRLRRPVYDTAGAYVLSPMEQGLRLTTGVELTARDAPKNLMQLHLAEQAAREAFPIGARLDPEPWLGCRPTLPDSRPIIGEAPGRQGLWLAFGHQHIGFCTAPGTARLLGALMWGESAAPIEPEPFRPGRFIR